MATATVLVRPTPRYAYDPRVQLDREDEVYNGPTSSTSTSYSTFSSRPDSPLNLGAESPGSILKPALTPSTSSLSLSSMYLNASTASSAPTRQRLWRSASFQRRRAEQQARRSRTPVDVNECGICFEVAVQPRKMRCCGSVFCLEHISNWIYDPSSDGCCPTCKTSYITHLPTPPPEYTRFDSHSHHHNHQRQPQQHRHQDSHHDQHHPHSIDSESDSDSSSSDRDLGDSDSTPHTSADEGSPAPTTTTKSRSMGSRATTFEGVDEYTYERIISIIGLTVVMCILVGYA